VDKVDVIPAGVFEATLQKHADEVTRQLGQIARACA
jgi:hypothetical protein